MKRISRKGIFYFAPTSLLVNAMLADLAISAQNHTAPIAALQPPSNYQDCVCFRLVGIPQADPIVQVILEPRISRAFLRVVADPATLTSNFEGTF
jgi:hypothetical protein